MSVRVYEGVIVPKWIFERKVVFLSVFWRASHSVRS